MKQLNQVHLIPTDKKPYSLESWGKWMFDTTDGEYSDREPKCIGQHLYFTSNEEIKEGDWCIDNYRNKLLQANSTILDQLNNGGFERDKGIERMFAKIIATTNPELWYKELPDISFRAHPNTFNKVRDVAQIPLSFIDAYIKAYNEGKPIAKVSLKTKTLVYKSFPDVEIVDLTNNGEVIVATTEEKLYTREEVIQILIASSFKRNLNGLTAYEWFQRNYPE